MTSTEDVRTLRAELSDTASARLGPARPLHFGRGHEALGVPAHVRAGSALRHWGERLVVVQDDVHALAVLDGLVGEVRPLALPPGADGKRVFSELAGNKALKMDLEACVVLPDARLVALGSGSSRARERVAVVAPGGHVDLLDGTDLYAGLRRCVEFSGSELNVEGAVAIGDELLLFQRGNGAAAAGRVPVNAIGSIALAEFVRWLDGGLAPSLGEVRQVDLGERDGVRYGFTDACALPDGRVAFLAGAEDSPDTYQDGVVVGARFGVVSADTVQVTDIHDHGGHPSTLKLEGIEFLDEDVSAVRFAVVTDMDAPESPAALHVLSVEA